MRSFIHSGMRSTQPTQAKSYRVAMFKAVDLGLESIGPGELLYCKLSLISLTHPFYEM